MYANEEEIDDYYLGHNQDWECVIISGVIFSATKVFVVVDVDVKNSGSNCHLSCSYWFIYHCNTYLITECL